MKISSLAGKPAEPSMIDVPKLVTAYYAEVPDSSVPEQKVAFGTSGHRGSAVAATQKQKETLGKLSPQDIRFTDLAGEKIQTILTKAPGNGAPIGGVKVLAQSGWFVARPSGMEEIYKIYAESFRGPDHLRLILEEAQAIVSKALAAPLQSISPFKTNVKEKP